MIVVADSSPLVVLISVGHVEVLSMIFQEIIIPQQVQAELASPRRPGSVRTFSAAPLSWLRVVSPTSIEHIEGLHTGETAAIALACELQADVTLIDEKRGRRAAAERGLRVIGTVGVLELAAERDLIDLGEAFEKVKKTDFWVSPRFLDERLALFIARKQPDSK